MENYEQSPRNISMFTPLNSSFALPCHFWVTHRFYHITFVALSPHPQLFPVSYIWSPTMRPLSDSHAFLFPISYSVQPHSIAEFMIILFMLFLSLLKVTSSFQLAISVPNILYRSELNLTLFANQVTSLQHCSIVARVQIYRLFERPAEMFVGWVERHKKAKVDGIR